MVIDLNKWKAHIFKTIVTIILGGICTGVWTIVNIVWSVPDQMNDNEAEHEALRKSIKELDDKIFFLHTGAIGPQRPIDQVKE